MSSLCPRLFEVEALRDGRLMGVERTRFERHLESCAACRKEATELDSLARALRTATDLPRDELHERRERTRLLESFDRSLLSGGRSHAAQKRWLWLCAAAALLAACLGLVFATDRGELPRANALIQTVDGATWSREVTEKSELIRLVQGELRIQVKESKQKRPLFVELPDGQLQDIGTTFTVLVEAGRTRRVAVEDGLVLLRLHGSPPLILTAGGTWTPAANTEPNSQPAVAQVQAVEPVALPSASSTSAAGESVSGAPRDSASLPDFRTASPALSHEALSHKAPDETPTPRDAASRAFRAAVATLDAGEPRRAAQEFTRFIEHYPGDARVEDAAYLRVLALQQSGDDTAMRAAAVQYLRRHPSGFRRAEVEKLAR